MTTKSRSFRRRAWTWAAVAGLALAFNAGSPAGADTTDPVLAKTLDRLISDTRLDGSQVGVVVSDAKTGQTLYQRDGSKRLVPASSTKLLTATAAMQLLGPDYRFSTDVLADGTRHGAVLKGDLYLRGTGDPTMLGKDYDTLAAQVAAAGIHRVTGKLIADDTRFDSNRLGASWAADDESAYYSSQISPLTVAPDTDYDAGTVLVKVAPGAAPGDVPVVGLTPANDYVHIENRATTVAAGQSNTLSVEREHGSNTIVVTGSVPVGSAAASSWISVWEPTGYATNVFAHALADHGVKVVGSVRLGKATPKQAKAVAAHPSMPLKDLLTPFLKLSNNNHAEVLVKTVGYEVKGSGTWSAGLSAISDYLRTLGVDPAALRQVDGSGLSRMDVVSPAQFTQLLVAVRHKPWFQDWYDALPIACVADRMTGGTLRSRMCGTPAAGNVHGKTGSLTGVSGLSGYVTDADGRELVFSVLSNNYVASSVKGIEDSIGAALASYRADGTGGTQRAVSPRAATRGGTGLECSWTKPASC
ncbi:D-alanyl-D-alanine carboxypeptidase/D-alanyl-D-alanine endopeptidase [Streptomyces beijiangensis]|uniref:D-alanyl-D-alanine carboxypeptidase/D-alanyl-D-alanine-endopeptidase n=1 Tax=Streptomyces beijiangensis TaxID=163361 RepID=A0A939F706_9ACTN|nr:D-alanyl-D-alanine carboxypeptidase/D-alanyl-D-alanine-endopeptidase [Streptomyces beijiangensis]MBO0513011.1 D-alanyl-D-alanine carboxypeptidase/D-alanyl-D-alanine-endopeptidase [Streptomyces beijiangensis]